MPLHRVPDSHFPFAGQACHGNGAQEQAARDVGETASPTTTGFSFFPLMVEKWGTFGYTVCDASCQHLEVGRALIGPFEEPTVVWHPGL